MPDKEPNPPLNHGSGLETPGEGSTRPGATPESRLPPTLASFGHRNFRLYWFGNLTSLIGTWMQNIATGWMVLTLTNSPFFVGLNSTVTWLPAWIVSLPAGAMADRFNRRNLMLWTQSLLAVFAMALAILTWTRVITIYHILLISTLSGFVVTMNGPIAQSLIPDLVNRKNVLNAIALNSAMFNSARIIGPSIAGVLLGTIGPGGCFGINSLSFLAIIGALLLIRLEPVERDPEQESVWRRILAGLKFVKNHADIRTLVIMTAVFSSFGIVYLPLMPVLARDVFHSGARGYGLMMTCIGIGAVVGGLTLATISRTRHKGWILVGGTFCLGVLVVGLSLARTFTLALPLLVLIGFCQTTIAALTNTLVQTLAHEQMRGRALSVYMVAFNGMFPIGSFFAGAVAQKLGAPAATLMGGCAVLISLAVVLLTHPQVRHL